MYIFNRMRQLYETAPPESTEYILSRYIILNIKRINSLSIVEISKETAISKSVISKFIKKLTFNNGFAQFKSSLEFELQYIQDRHIQLLDAKEIENLSINIGKYQGYQLYNFISMDSVKKFARLLDKKKKIIFFGDDSKKSFFHNLINIILFDGKDAKFASYVFTDNINKELSSLDSSSLMVLIDLSSNLYDFTLRVSMSVDMPRDLGKINCDKYYIGRPSKIKDSFSILEVETTKQLFLEDIVLTFLCSQIIKEYLLINTHA